MVRRVGPGVPRHPAGDDRPGVRQAAAGADDPRVVHASERAAPRLRVGIRRRQPAGPRLGGCRRSTRSTPQRSGEPDVDFLEAVFHKLLHQLHLVGQPQGPRRQQRVPGRVPRARQHQRVRPRRRRCRGGGHLDQSDGTAWMAFYTLEMLRIALELATTGPCTRTSPPSSSSTSWRSPRR